MPDISGIDLTPLLNLIRGAQAASSLPEPQPDLANGAYSNEQAQRWIVWRNAKIQAAQVPQNVKDQMIAGEDFGEGEPIPTPQSQAVLDAKEAEARARAGRRPGTPSTTGAPPQPGRDLPLEFGLQPDNSWGFSKTPPAAPLPGVQPISAGQVARQLGDQIYRDQPNVPPTSTDAGGMNLLPQNQRVGPDQWGFSPDRLKMLLGQLAPQAAQPETQHDFSKDIEAAGQAWPAIAPYLQNLRMQWGKGEGYSEFYPPWESENPNPDKITIELRDQSKSGNWAPQQMIQGEMLHYLGSTDPRTGQPVDPQWLALKNALLQARSPQDIALDKRTYQEEEPDQGRSFEDWMQESRGDAYIRGYFSPDTADEWRKGGTYTPQMQPILDQMQTYLKTPPKSKKDDDQ
jgi:hypothetical protein